MATNYIQDGATITITAAAAIKSGDPVVVGDIVAVALTDIEQHAQGEAKADGVWSLPKGAGAIAQGVAVYLDSNEISTTDTGTYAGVAWRAAENGDTHIDVKLAHVRTIIKPAA